MKPYLLVGLALVALALLGCTAQQQAQVKPVLTEAAKAACAQQSVLNGIAEVGGVVAGAAVGMPAVGTISASAASAIVGAGCTWVNG